MTWRRAGISLNVFVAVFGLAGCNGGPTEPEEGRFGIGNSNSFVTTGGAEVTFIVNAYINRMSFNAKGNPASGVFNFQGKLGLFFELEDNDMHGNVFCYSIATTLTGHEAHVAGVITRSDLFPTGAYALWAVEDNGEPGSSGLVRDRITVVGIADAPDAAVVAQTFCDGGVLPLGLPYDPTTFPIETGNVQVHL